MICRTRLALALAVVTFVSLSPQTAAQEDRWARSMARFEEADRASPPTPGGVIFTGSSSIRGWDLEKSFPGKGYINRGFGGSQVSDAIEHINTIVLKHKPRMVVIYSGDNDIQSGKSAETVFEDIKTFTDKIHAALPETRIAVMSVKPSIARWDKVNVMRKANMMIRDYAMKTDHVGFVDVDGAMLGWDGKPNPAFFVRDGLHLTPEGYEIWAAVLKPFLTVGESPPG